MHTHIHTYIHAHIHLRIYTHTQASRQTDRHIHTYPWHRAQSQCLHSHRASLRPCHGWRGHSALTPSDPSPHTCRVTQWLPRQVLSGEELLRPHPTAACCCLGHSGFPFQALSLGLLANTHPGPLLPWNFLCVGSSSRHKRSTTLPFLAN